MPFHQQVEYSPIVHHQQCGINIQLTRHAETLHGGGRVRAFSGII